MWTNAKHKKDKIMTTSMNTDFKIDRGSGQL